MMLCFRLYGQYGYKEVTVFCLGFALGLATLQLLELVMTSMYGLTWQSSYFAITLQGYERLSRETELLQC